MNSILKAALILMLLWPGRVTGFEPVTDQELAGTSGTAGLAFKLYADKILDEPNLTPEEAEQLWRAMTPEERDQARRIFRRELMQMSPQEKIEIRQQMLNQFLSLSNEEQAAVRKLMRSRVVEMSPDETTEFIEFRRHMLQPVEAMPKNGEFFRTNQDMNR